MEPQIKKYFLDENLIKQNIYKAKNYEAIYINEKLFEEIYNIEFKWENAKDIIEEEFSITLEPNNEITSEIAYIDKQKDPFNIALSGNLGSGRAFFYKNIYNIKGQKTNLATSKKDIYSNGKFALSAAIKEAIIANIIKNDFEENAAFQTLAILTTNTTFTFEDQYLDNNNKIKSNFFNLPCAIEIRVYEEDDLLRLSNDFINNKTFTENDLLEIIDNFAKLEANKFCNQFLHGSWSTGNITKKAKMIDYDTSAFIDFRNPQYSNTNKYKDNYFGFEYLGAEKIINKIIKNNNLSIDTSIFFDKYKKNCRKYFLNLIGIYNSSDDDLINEIFEMFFEMCKYYTNYTGTFIYNEESNFCAVYNFSLFFQKYLILKNKDNDIITGLRLLLNNYSYNEDCPQLTIDKNKEFFDEYFIDKNNQNKIFEKAIEFIKLYDKLFNNYQDDLLYNQYIKNEPHYYVNGTNNLFSILSDDFYYKRLSVKDINKIINTIIKSNFRKISRNNNIRLNIYDDFMIYTITTKTNYSIKIIPFDKYKIKFAKLIVNNIEYMFHHFEDFLISDLISIDSIKEFENSNIKIIINNEIKITY